MRDFFVELCLAMVTYDQGRYERSIQLFDKVFADKFEQKKFHSNRFEMFRINIIIVHFMINSMLI